MFIKSINSVLGIADKIFCGTVKVVIIFQTSATSGAEVSPLI